MLRVAVVTRYFPSSGEPWQGRSAYQTIRVLSRQANVKVFYPNAAYPRLLQPRSRLYESLDRSFAPRQVEVEYIDFPAVPLLSRPINGRLAARRLESQVGAFAPDLIFSIFLYPDSYAALQIAKQLRVPLVAMGIGSDIHSIGDPISAIYTRRVLREANFVVTVSDDLRRRALKMGAAPDRSRAVVNGCDLSVFRVRDKVEARRQLGVPAESAAVVYIGRTDVRKGLRELGEAAAALHVSQPNLRVYLVGQGPDRPVVEQAIRARDAGAYIQVLPPCAPDDVSTWMAAADVVTLPSYMEGCPNVILEALACGRPVVATHVGGIPEIMNDECGRLVPPRDAAALREGLESALNTSWDAEAISAHWGRSWETVAQELMEIFESVALHRQAALHER